MKKALALLLTVAMLMSMLTACGGSKPAAAPAAPAAKEDDFLNWPYKNTEILCPLAAGGGTDLAGRVLAQALTEATGKNFIVTNNTNGSGSEVYFNLADASDCSTLSFTLGSYFSGYWTGVHDSVPGEDIVPASVIQVVGTSPIFCVPANSKYNTFKDVLDDMKANPGTVRFGIPTGGINYFQGYELKNTIGFDCRFVDAAGDSEKITGMMGGTIDIGTINANQAKQYIEAGELKPLIALLPFDNDKMPEVVHGLPTFEDEGYTVPKCLVNTYYVLASSEADKEEVEQLNKLVNYVMNLDSTKEAMAKINQYVETLTYEEGQANFEGSNKSYYDVSVAAGILADARK
ncbi:MAG: hypothetical protein II995_05160 [Oscillospiraceae bacterium]|nr:hypothetical protein [Oscillospiraceae bacterium]